MKLPIHWTVVVTLGAVALLVARVGFVANPLAFSVPHQAAAAAAVCADAPVAPSLAARAAYVYDVRRDTALFEKAPDAQMPLASLTKMMTALVSLELLGEEASVTVSKDALLPEGDSGLVEGEVWRVSDLVDFMLITSSNDGARALGLTTPDVVAAMNAKAQTLGLTQTYFLNETGLDVSSTTAGAYGSARDMATLAVQLPRLNDRARLFTSYTGTTHQATHTSTLAGSVPGGIFFKTGFTDLSGGNLALVAEPLVGTPVVVVVLGSSREARDDDALALYEFAKQKLRASPCQ